jgi:imidazoleglycerol phosphate dehydratase HisB
MAKHSQRVSTVSRQTAETDITLTLAIDGRGQAKIATGVPFFDHMLTLFAKHGLFDLTVQAKGDVEVDYHHTVEDVGLVLGQAFKEALGDKLGIKRYGFFILPMDESLARVVVDVGGRPHLVYHAEAPTMFVRDQQCARRESPRTARLRRRAASRGRGDLQMPGSRPRCGDPDRAARRGPPAFDERQNLNGGAGSPSTAVSFSRSPDAAGQGGRGILPRWSRG